MLVMLQAQVQVVIMCNILVMDIMFLLLQDIQLPILQGILPLSQGLLLHQLHLLIITILLQVLHQFLLIEKDPLLEKEILETGIMIEDSEIGREITGEDMIETEEEKEAEKEKGTGIETEIEIEEE